MGHAHRAFSSTYPIPARVGLEETARHRVAAPWVGRRGLPQEFHFTKPQRTQGSPATIKVKIWGLPWWHSG